MQSIEMIIMSKENYLTEQFHHVVKFEFSVFSHRTRNKMQKRFGWKTGALGEDV
jgi:hypothetical protein